MRDLVERAYFLVCRALGALLRSGRYAKTEVQQDGGLQVRKVRCFYAPLLVAMGRPLMTFLDTGVRVLGQRDWEARERLLYSNLRGVTIRIDSDGSLVLPRLPGRTLAALLEDTGLLESARKRAIELAVAALAELHRRGFTHGDAMAENVMVDLDAEAANWFDFETIHESSRPARWCRADDLRALLATCLLRTVPERRAETIRFVLDLYPDAEASTLLSMSFAPVVRRALAFHLGQAGLAFQDFSEIAAALEKESRREASGGRPASLAPSRG